MKQAVGDCNILMIFDKRSERNIGTLHLSAQVKAREFLALAISRLRSERLEVRIISGTRTYAEQDALYAKGRTAPGPRVTNARGGYSNHNFGIAWDIGIFQGGRYFGTSLAYRVCGQIGESIGLEWGGSWKSFKDEPHFQLRTGLSLAQMRARVAAGLSVV